MQITLRFDDELADEVKRRKPKRQALSAFCLDLIEQALTPDLSYAPTVSVRETNNTPVDTPKHPVNNSGSSGCNQAAVKAVPLEPKSSTESIDSTVQKKRKTQGSDEFNAFWKLYQSCPLKANTQRKNKAWDEWRKAIKIETPERLTEALENAIAAINRGQNIDGWAAPLPDCFRWLRDGCYTAALEDHKPQDDFAAAGITFLS